MAGTIDFLRHATEDRLRREMQNITDSYSHPWDMLAELAQNSVDAIRLHTSRHGSELREHEILIDMDRSKRSIRFRDSGIGFPRSQAIDLLAPHGTDKLQAGYAVIGEKGVGLTYVIFSADRVHLKAASEHGTIEGDIERACLWKNGKHDQLPVFQVLVDNDMPSEPAETFTEILLEDIEQIYPEGLDIFDQTLPVLEFLLRTKTALGSTETLFRTTPPTPVKVALTVREMDGSVSENEFPMRFMTPEELLRAADWMDLEDFVKTAAKLDDRQRTQRLQGKCLRKKGAISRAGKDIKFYAFFVPSRNTWNEMSNKNGLTQYDPDRMEDVSLYEPGIFIGTRGMPTGVELTPPSTGFAGYWPNAFMLIEDDSLNFDLGRKSIPGRTQGLLRDVARDLFNEFTAFARYITKDPPVTPTISAVAQYQKATLFAELEQLPDLAIQKLSFLKHPDSQEAAVSAIFHELIATGLLSGYEVLKMGYKMTYDLWGTYTLSESNVGKQFWAQIEEGNRIPVVIEFKYRAEDILDDFEKNIKFFTDIDLLVCWDLDDTKLAKQSVDVEIINQNEAFFHGSNYRLVWPGAYNLGEAGTKPVLALRRFVEDLAK